MQMAAYCRILPLQSLLQTRVAMCVHEYRISEGPGTTSNHTHQTNTPFEVDSYESA